MKKVIALLLAVCLLSACTAFESDTMTCTLQYQSNHKIEYNVEYRGDSVEAIQIKHIIDFSAFADVDYQNQLKMIKSDAKENNKIDGVSETVAIDGKTVTETLEVDIDDYDVIKDNHYLLNVYLKKKDLKTVKALRKKLQESYFNCDELTKK